MKLKKEWSNWKIFLVSVAISLISTAFIEPIYSEFFRVSGGFFFPPEFETFPISFMFMYTLFFSLFYMSFSKGEKSLTVFYFLVLPFFLLAASGIDRLVAGLILLVIGIALGKIIRSKFA